MSEFSNVLQNRRLQVVGSVLALSAVLGACSNESDTEPAAARTSSTPEAPVATAEQTQNGHAETRQSKYHITFDFLNHGSQVIDVYESPESKRATGSFQDGQSAPAYCKEEGRTVTSGPGETPQRSSDEWIKVMTNSTDNSTEYYASAVYIEDPEQILEMLPDCQR